MKLKKRTCVFVALIVAVSCNLAPPLTAQSVSTRPTEALRQADASPVLLRGAEVIAAPGQSSIAADVLIDGTTIVAVGSNIAIPAGTEIRDLSGKRIYAGLIDAMHEVESSDDSASNPAAHWNANVTPHYRIAADGKAIDEGTDDAKKLRSQGITARLLAPDRGIIKGASCLVLLVDENSPQRMLRENVFQHATLTVPRGKSRDRYPNSPMGATALVRQSLSDSIWYRDANQVYQRKPTLPRPEPNVALEALADAIETQTFVFDAPNERMAIRSADVADEFTVRAIIRGSGREYRSIDEIAQPGRRVLLPVNFPDAPDAKTVASIRESTLVEWLHWHFAPQNPARLDAAGIPFCLTTDGLDDVDKFLKQVRIAIEQGLSPSTALAALTTTPAKWLGVDDQTGRVAPGMLANLAITDGDLFDKKTKIVETWVAGRRFVVDEQGDQPDAAYIGSWTLNLLNFNIDPKAKAGQPITLRIAKEKNKLTAKLVSAKDDAENGDVTLNLKDLIAEQAKLSASGDLSALDDSFPSGISHLTLLVVPVAGEEARDTIFASLTSPDGTTQFVEIERADAKKEASDGAADGKQANEGTQSPSASAVSIELLMPLGAYGLTEPPQAPASVLFRGATVWTCDPNGTVDQVDVLVRDGKIADIGPKLSPPQECQIVDAVGKHMTPGLIDCHTHIATDGGINESGQVVTAEVRIGDFIDNSDISIYRQLAGGITTANVLHGSANPIGGQSQTIKLRWGDSMKRMKFDGAPPGIKFALGENVKRTTSRYPNTRMGVEQLLRDQLLAARQYDARQQAWRTGERDGLPPRRDLQLEALVEVQQGDRWVHCHSYRQDEIVATLDVLEEFNNQIGTLQHILEGYKVADRIAEHGAMASSFSDWWAYKFEVFDAIPYNGVLMHNAGVVVSFNSDDAELARHLNTEAAKATKYGGVPESEALKFVTLNPAKQLRIDDRVGSIEVGKDADLVLWSGRPLSTTTRCEQTWIDGRNYFSLLMDQQLRDRDQRLKSRLVQLAIDTSSDDSENGDDSKQQKKPKEPSEEDRWVRYDVFCGAGGNRGVTK